MRNCPLNKFRFRHRVYREGLFRHLRVTAERHEGLARKQDNLDPKGLLFCGPIGTVRETPQLKKIYYRTFNGEHLTFSPGGFRINLQIAQRGFISMRNRDLSRKQTIDSFVIQPTDKCSALPFGCIKMGRGF